MGRLNKTGKGEGSNFQANTRGAPAEHRKKIGDRERSDTFKPHTHAQRDGGKAAQGLKTKTSSTDFTTLVVVAAFSAACMYWIVYALYPRS